MLQSLHQLLRKTCLTFPNVEAIQCRRLSRTMLMILNIMILHQSCPKVNMILVRSTATIIRAANALTKSQSSIQKSVMLPQDLTQKGLWTRLHLRHSESIPKNTAYLIWQQQSPVKLTTFNLTYAIQAPTTEQGLNLAVTAPHPQNQNTSL